MRSLYIYSFLALAFASVAGAQIVLDPNPARVAGHPATMPPEQLLVTNINPNFGAGGGMYSPEGVAVDTNGSSPILYVADTYNNRILAWKNATSTTLTNQQAPDLIIGQPDACTTLPTINGGLYLPTGLLVDSKSNLYVVDGANNRVLRYPAPFAGAKAAACPAGTSTQISTSIPDIVLGQPDKFTSNRGNQGAAISAQTICLYRGCPSGGSFALFSSLAMDSNGDLFLADAGNDRVLRYSAPLLTSGAVDPAADLVIGQVSFTKVIAPTGDTDRNTLSIPQGLAFDSAGHLFVTDSYSSAISRLVVFPAAVSSPGATNGPAAIRLAGVVTSLPPPATASTMFDAEGIVMINNGPAVLDMGDNRLLMFDAFSSTDWTVTTGDTTFSTPPPVAVAALGQGSSLTNFASVSANAGNAQPSSSTFASPFSAALAGTDLFVVDSANNRVLVFPNAGQTAAASVALGQNGFVYNSPNSIQGKEFYFGPNTSSAYDAGIAVDSSSGTPHLYIADPNNNRVLGFADARKFGPGVKADIVIGEPDMMTAVCNYGGVTNPTTEALPRQPTASSLCYPTGLAVDPGTGPSGAATQGDLYVADSSNGRVLRFPAPFAQSSGQQANLVLGQTGFTGISNPQASQSVTAFPYGLVFDPQRGLLVSDESANRVLVFSISSPANGEPASTVIGQTNFVGTGNSVLSSPHHIGEDSIGELYVADTGHNQIQIFDIPTGTSTNTPVTSFTGLNSPVAVWVNQNTVAGYHDDIWVGDASGITRWPTPNPLGTNASSLAMPAAEMAGPNLICTSSLCEFAAIAITQDNFGALYVADVTNRVAVHYPALAAENGGSFTCAMGCNLGGLTDPQSYLAPGAFASLFLFNGLSFASSTTINGVLPVPTTLGGLQVLVNSQPSPITSVSSSQINFIVPFEAPASGTAQVVVANASTSQVLGSGAMTLNSASPGFFTTNAQGTGQIAALNQDNTVNSPTNMAKPNSYVQLFLTGQGLVPNAPADGQPPNGTVSTSSKPTVYVGGSLATVQFSGLAPGYPGLWQINIQIPQDPIALADFPTNIFPVLVDYEGLPSNTSTRNGNPNYATTIAVNAQ
jgi:uncharacterized protein (TIGR03437 family)